MFFGRPYWVGELTMTGYLPGQGEAVSQILLFGV
jgi:hypothetical protein